MICCRMHLKYEVLEEKLASRLDAMFSVKGSLIEVNPGKVLVPPKYQDLGERIVNLKVRPDDVWAVAYPRTGNIKVLIVRSGYFY